jgi:hypothetical protein
MKLKAICINLFLIKRQISFDKRDEQRSMDLYNTHAKKIMNNCDSLCLSLLQGNNRIYKDNYNIFLFVTYK